ncbi:MAG: anhydro-N-acetylmuramic acid kinase [Chitinophagales bacterium]
MPQSTSSSYYAIGLMSGSSLDGLDITYCKYTHEPSSSEKSPWSFLLLEAKTAKLGPWEEKLRAAIHLLPEELDVLSVEFSFYLAEQVKDFIDEFQLRNIDVVVSHGHTIYHYPEEGRSCQIGDGETLAKYLDLPVVNNLRQEDINHGGQGAPIVPIGDKYLFQDYQFCLNIGGIANISVRQDSELIAFDICAANQVLNYYAEKCGLPYDDKGKLARKGNLNKVLLENLNQLDFYKREYPKSLDNAFSKQAISIINDVECDEKNALNTYVEHLAIQISSNIKTIARRQSLSISESASMLITGGGAFNTYLIERIVVNSELNVIIPPADIINYKEAIVMGFIGVLRMRDEVNVLASVTGAYKDTSCGDIYLPKS